MRRALLVLPLLLAAPVVIPSPATAGATTASTTVLAPSPVASCRTRH